MPVEDMDHPPLADPRLAGLFAYNDQRKRSSRENLLVAATELFSRRGYAAVSVEDITIAAGVSRITYYRHFPSKAAVALELFQRATEIAAPSMLAIGARDVRLRRAVARSGATIHRGAEQRTPPECTTTVDDGTRT
mgnify:CR=1 FL=1